MSHAAMQDMDERQELWLRAGEAKTIQRTVEPARPGEIVGWRDVAIGWKERAKELQIKLDAAEAENGRWRGIARAMMIAHDTALERTFMGLPMPLLEHIAHYLNNRYACHLNLLGPRAQAVKRLLKDLIENALGHIEDDPDCAQPPPYCPTCGRELEECIPCVCSNKGNRSVIHRLASVG